MCQKDAFFPRGCCASDGPSQPRWTFKRIKRVSIVVNNTSNKPPVIQLIFTSAPVSSPPTMFVTSLFEIIKRLCRENWLIVSFGVASSQRSVIASSAWAPVPQAADENPRTERKIPRKTAGGKKKGGRGPVSESGMVLSTPSWRSFQTVRLLILGAL